MKKVFSQRRLINIALVTMLLSAMACGPESNQKGTPLPYYNSADFTPEWIEESQSEYHDIHQIADFSFKNQDDKLISNETLMGKIYVADFFFTSCPSICPKMTSNLSRVQEEFIGDTGVQLLSYSVMPWVDSVAVLKSYAEIKGINSDQWNLLTGAKEDIYQLARTSYFAEKEIGLSREANEFLHTENFILVDEEGRIRGVYNGTLALEVTRLITDIKTLRKLG